MNLNIKTTKDKDEIAEFVSSSINEKLKQGERVLWFVSGGSSISVEVKIAEKIDSNFSNKLVVILGDERFGPLGHLESNWEQLIDAGFDIKGASMIPILKGKDMRKTTEEIKMILKDELKRADYKIGFFGVGIDMHTSGILPHTDAVKSDDLVCTYETDLYDRITITFKTIQMLDEAVLYAMGEVKWGAIESLKNDLPIDSAPVQILKRVSKLTIFTDYNNE